MEKDMSKCPMCGSSKALFFYDKGAPYPVKVDNRICSSCGLIYQKAIPTSGELGDYYGKYMEKTQGTASISVGFEDHILAISRLRLQFLKPFLRAGMRVLDIGCSFGAMLKVLRDESGFSLDVCGVNPEEGLAKFGREHYGLDIRTGMFEDQNFAPGSFDLIILDNVIEHFADPKQSVRAIYDLLTPGGLLFVATNNAADPHGFLWQNFFPDHTVTFSMRTLRAVLESGGLACVAQDDGGHDTYEGYHYPYQLCVARKQDAPPKDYDFSINGDNALEVIGAARKYMGKIMASNRWGKMLYLLQHEKELGLFEKAKLFLLRAARRLSLFESHSVTEHTLPPKEFLVRRVVVAECKSVGDVSTAFRIAAGAGITRLVILKDGKVSSWSSKYLGVDAPEEGGWAGVLGALRKNLDAYRQIIRVKLKNADLPDDALERLLRAAEKGGLPKIVRDYSQFTDAVIEIHNPQAYGELTSENSTGSEHPDTKCYLWPDRKDYEYYYITSFDKYFAIPQSVSLDLSPACNKKCPKCQFHSGESPFRNYVMRDELMDLEKAKSLLDQVARWKKKPSICPTFSGEPLLYPHLEEFLAHAKSRGLSVSMTTNGQLLTPEMSKMLLAAKVGCIMVSVDAATPETYQKLQPPGELGEVVENLTALLKLRGGSSTPTIGVHFVMEEANKNEFDSFLAYWGDKVDLVSRAIKQDQMTTCHCVLPMFQKLGPRQACFAAWTSLTVRNNGEASFCGFDIEIKNRGLNAFEMPLLDIWNSEEYWKWRKAQVNNDRNVLYCMACPDWAGLRPLKYTSGGFQVSQTPITECYRRA